MHASNLIFISFCFFFTPFLASWQAKFLYDQKGLQPDYVVVEVPRQSQTELYQKAIKWIKYLPPRPEAAILVEIENEMLRFRGGYARYLCIYSMDYAFCYDTYYTVQIEFKDDKYKFTPLIVEYLKPASGQTGGTLVNVALKGELESYNKNGKLKSSHVVVPRDVQELFNVLNAALKTYLETGKKSQSQTEDDWE
ncbi:MAG: hypothetical protein OHK0053_36890 [Microscillaceae bacterium]